MKTHPQNDMLTKYFKLVVEAKKHEMLDEAIAHMRTKVKINPYYLLDGETEDRRWFLFSCKMKTCDEDEELKVFTFYLGNIDLKGPSK